MIKTNNMVALAAALVLYGLAFTLRKFQWIRKRTLRRVVTLLLLLAALAALLIMILVPLRPPLDPTGPYKYGVKALEFAQDDREDPFRKGQPRRIAMDLYYPEGDIPPHSAPLILFSHGGIATKTGNISLFIELASHGYVVASVDHPGHALYTRVGGRRVWMDGGYSRDLSKEDSHKDPEGSFRLFQQWMDLRTQDLSAVIDWLGQQADSAAAPFSLIDTRKIGVAGHSLGGSAALAMARVREDVLAVAALESPYMYDIEGVKGDRFIWSQAPYQAAILNIYSDNGMKLIRSDHKYVQNEKHMVNDGKLSYVHIEGSNHFTLTDLARSSPFFCRILGGGYQLSEEEGLRQVNRACLEFFDKHLK